MAAQTKVVNCIDVSNPDIHQSAAILKQAFENSGFLYVINHGMSEEFINEVFAQVKKFFALSYDVKMKLLMKRNRGFRDNTKLVDEKTNLRAYGETFISFHEAGRDTENLWPPSDILPGWKETMIRYQQETLNLNKAITRIIATALDLNIDFFDQWELLGNAQSILGLNHYKGDNHSKEYLIGVPPHSDPHIITLLAMNDVPGLQICKDMDAKPQLWNNVLPLKGAFVVFVGNMLERMSNCVFRSTYHRVLFNQERYSTGSFLFPSRDGIIECLPSCKSTENPPKYPPINCEEFLDYINGNSAYKLMEKE